MSTVDFWKGQASVALEAGFARDVFEGLTKPGQKELPSTYLYDDLGSCLFEAITKLDEYGLTRADERLIGEHADEIAAAVPRQSIVAELGSGSGRKTRHILEALGKQGRRPLYYPIDISGAALTACRQELSPFATVMPVEETYLEGLRRVTNLRPPGRSILLLFLGSTIGNFDRDPAKCFLRRVHSLLLPGDALLLGTDLVKAEGQLIDAYDDPPGVTAAFNKNVLARINRELGGTFDLRLFDHVATYDHARKRVEMHLRSRTQQTVRIEALQLNVPFAQGETIWTESSHKFERADLPLLAAQTGFEPKAAWVDSEWPFAENLWIVPARPLDE